MTDETTLQVLLRRGFQLSAMMHAERVEAWKDYTLGPSNIARTYLYVAKPPSNGSVLAAGRNGTDGAGVGGAGLGGGGGGGSGRLSGIGVVTQMWLPPDLTALLRVPEALRPDLAAVVRACLAVPVERRSVGLVVCAGCGIQTAEYYRSSSDEVLCAECRIREPEVEG